eukprot:1843719-Alexandrium_andersonii.AAC.1
MSSRSLKTRMRVSISPVARCSALCTLRSHTCVNIASWLPRPTYTCESNDHCTRKPCRLAHQYSTQRLVGGG